MKKGRLELTQRELEIVRLIWEELTAKEIATQLHISPRTVEAHRWNIARKLGARSTVGIIKYALLAGFIKLPDS